jgi:serine/threonine protein kinase
MINGWDLLKTLGGCEKLSEQDTAQIMRQLLSAVAHLAGRSIAHRDIKLENILYDASTHTAFLADFGLAEL